MLNYVIVCVNHNFHQKQLGESLCSAAGGGKLEKVAQLIKVGVDPNFKDKLVRNILPVMYRNTLLKHCNLFCIYLFQTIVWKNSINGIIKSWALACGAAPVGLWRCFVAEG